MSFELVVLLPGGSLKFLGKTNIEFNNSVQVNKQPKLIIPLLTYPKAYKMRKLELQIGLEISRGQQQEPKSKPASWIVPFDRNQNYVDGEVMEQVSRSLFDEPGISKVAVYGLGGIGKTQIALELAYRAIELDPKCSVFWVPAMSPESIRQAYLNIASHLGLVVVNQEKAEVSRLIQEYLSSEASGQWLLIFDNADDVDVWEDLAGSNPADDLRNLLPNSPLGSILFTTRSTKVAQSLTVQKVFNVPQMDLKRAMRVLRNLILNKKPLDDEEGTRELLERLIYLPLAIVQAAAFINQNGMNIKGYIALLDGQEEDVITLLSEDFEDKGRYKSIRNPVATTWLTSFEQIRKKTPSAADALAFMAFLSPRDIPISLIPCSNPVEQRKTLGILQAYNLIRLQPDSEHLDLHRLVHLAMRNSLRSSDSLSKWKERVLEHLSQIFPQPETYNQNKWRDYLPHAFHFLDSDSNSGPGRALLQSKMAGCLILEGRTMEAATILRKVLKYNEETVGVEHRDTLYALSGLSICLTGQRRLEEAKELETQVLQTSLKVFGPDSLNVANSLGYLCGIYLQLGNLQIAEWLGISAFKGRLKNLGLEHHQTGIILTYMVAIYLRQGRLSNAMEAAEKFNSITARVCGPKDMDTISAQGLLSTIYIEQGLWDKAAALTTETLATAEEVLGPEHPTTLNNMQTLAKIYQQQGRSLEAASLVIEMTRRSEGIYGPDHDFIKGLRDTAKSYKKAK